MSVDGFLHQLENAGVGYYMGGVFAGERGYTDDLKMLTPSLNALIIIIWCYVLINGKNSLLIIYKCRKGRLPLPNIYIKNFNQGITNK